MAVVNKDVLKAYFNNGKVPNEGHYSDLIDSLYNDFGSVIGIYQMLLGLRGFWPYTSLGGSGDTDRVKDLSGNGLHLTRNGGTVYLNGTAGTNSLAPNASYQGTRYDSRVSEAALNIAGDTSDGIYSPQRGLTVGAWIRTTTDNVVAVTGLMSKYTGTTGQRQYLLGINTPTDNRARFTISQDGTNVNTAYNAANLIGNGSGWNFVVGKFEPEIPELVVWVNDNKGTPVATSITSIFTSGTTAFQLARYAGDSNTQFQGRMALPILVASAIPDWQIQLIYNCTKNFFEE